MIYKYPKEFIVPVIYVNDLKENSIYRKKTSKSSHGGKLIMLDEEEKGDAIFQANIDIYEIIQEPAIKKNIVGVNIEDEYINSILSDIDEEYANSETLTM